MTRLKFSGLRFKFYDPDGMLGHFGTDALTAMIIF
jgi:hypothetical protein